MKSISLNNVWTEKLILRNKILDSRFFLAPINTGYSYNGSPSDKLIYFHSRRSGNRIGISYIGNIAIGHEYKSNNSTIIFKESDRNTWNNITKTIKQNGSLAGVQIGCKCSKIESMKKFYNKNGKDYIDDASQEILEISNGDISNIIDMFVDSIIFASSVGFDVVQIHAAHGYLLSQLVSNNINYRTDNYGKDKVNILKQIVEKVREYDNQIIIDIRLSIIEGIKSKEEELNYKIHILEETSKLDIDIISITHGIYNLDKNLIYPNKDDLDILNIDDMVNICNINKNILWNFAGVTWSIQKYIDNINADNISFSIGRGLISDPLYVSKLLNDSFDSIIECSDCGECHYYSNGYGELVCVKWGLNNYTTVYKDSQHFNKI